MRPDIVRSTPSTHTLSSIDDGLQIESKLDKQSYAHLSRRAAQTCVCVCVWQIIEADLVLVDGALSHSRSESTKLCGTMPETVNIFESETEQKQSKLDQLN